MRTLVTGSNGFVGSHFLKSYGGFGLNEAGRPRVDLMDLGSLQERVSELKPDAVLHLAAQTFVPTSFADPKATFEVNFFGTWNLLEALRVTGFQGRVLYVGSAEGYGRVQDSDLPIRETLPQRPRSPYAVSKVAAEALCFQANLNSDFEIVLCRPFNQIGPGQDERFVISNFAKQIVEIKLGRRLPVVEVGDLEVSRDFTDVRDTVKAYSVLLQKGEAGEIYNVCSGIDRKIRHLLEKLMEIEEVDPKIESAPSRKRTSDQRRVVGSFEKLHHLTGWQPQLKLDLTLRDVLGYWKERLS